MGFFSKLFKKRNKNEPNKSTQQNVLKEDNKETLERPTIPKQKEIAKEDKPQNKPEYLITKNESPDSSSDQTVAKLNTQSGFFEIKKSKDDRFVFNLYASNKIIIATSQIYSSSQSALNGANSVIANAEKANIEDQTLKNYTTMSYPKWEIYKDKAGEYRFRLSASNGNCICHSQGYTSKANCKNGIDSIIRTVKTAKIDKAYLK